MASAIISVGLTPESRAVIAQWREVESRLVDALDAGMTQYLNEVASSIKQTELTGGLVDVRTGGLRQAVVGEQDGPLSGFVGTTQGTTTPYARAILGPDDTTIKPVNAKHLWVPIAKNLNPSGIAKFTPKALFDTFGDRVKIFTSKKGNTVVFVEDEANEDGSKKRYTRKTKAGRQKGDLKGQLMFVLKDEVVIHGTDALAIGAQRMQPRGAAILTEHLRRAFPGGDA